MHATDVAAYTFQAEILCPRCLRRKAAFDAEANGRNAEFVPLDTLLIEWAKREGIDYLDERSYDSDDFPKVVFCSNVEQDETCTFCRDEL